MGVGRKLAVLTGILAIFGIEVLLLVTGIMTRSILRCVIAFGAISFTVYFFYVRLYQKKKAKYPLVPPEGKADVYFPRTDIPRPVHADLRQLQEKKRKLEKTRKKLRTKKRR